mmetsp:Transcript_15978/g.21790  ORF Transcript_15978/g.21790 Transcript_15978/m.21790 type:complete len:203 (-) Transcript_15978:733-1341(-)
MFASSISKSWCRTPDLARLSFAAGVLGDGACESERSAAAGEHASGSRPQRMASFSSPRLMVPSPVASIPRKTCRNSLVSSGASSCARSCSTALFTREASAYRFKFRRASLGSDGEGAFLACSHLWESAARASRRVAGSLTSTARTKSMASWETFLQRLLWLQSTLPARMFARMSFSLPWNGGYPARSMKTMTPRLHRSHLLV